MALLKGENPYIYGLHDRGGEHLMMANGEAKGWVLVTEAIGTEAHERGGSNYSDLANKGLGVIVRLNQSYGSNGTIPREARYPEFAQRVANFVQASPGANIWLIGNEMNLEREQPRREGSDKAEPITPRRYATCYKMCRDAIHRLPGHENDLVMVGAIGPWNTQTPYEKDPDGAYPANSSGDWIVYMRDMLRAIGANNFDAIAIHAYSHGYAAELVFNDGKMNPPFQNRHFHFYTYKDQMNAIPQDMKHLPVYLTEANGDIDGNPPPSNNNTWTRGNNGWIKNAYEEINNWNMQRRNQQIRCMILFRWMRDPHGWSIDGKSGVQEDFKQAVARNYRWRQSLSSAPEEITPGEVITVNIPTSTGIQIQDVSANLTTGDGQPAYGRRNTSAIKRFIVHHTATAASVPVERIANYQVQNRNLPGISYHYCVDADGKVFQTQPPQVVTRHAGQHSDDSLGVCLIGNFTEAAPPEKQLSSAAALMAHLAGEYKITPSKNTVVGYRDLVTTVSPGDTWPNWRDPLIAAINKQLGREVTIPTTPEPQPPEPQVPGYLAEYVNHNTPTTTQVQQDVTVNLVIRNKGRFRWVSGGSNPFRLGFRWADSNNQLVQLPSNLDYRTGLPRDVEPNQSVTLQARLRTPDSPGRYRLQWDMVHEQITWFSTQGDPGLIVNNINVAAVPTTTPAPIQPVSAIRIQNVVDRLATNTAVTQYARRNLQTVQQFVIHHTATNAGVSVERIASFQTSDRNMPGISYHYCVTDQGIVYQTQPLETVTLHASRFSQNSIGVCLIGNFTESAPPEQQLNATAALIAQVGAQLRISASDTTVRGYSELVTTASPGATWPQWKPTLIRQAQAIQTGAVTTTPAPTTTTPAPQPQVKVIQHYMLFWNHGNGNWAEWDMLSALDYIGRFAPTVGFSLDEAKQAQFVTIIGGPAGVPSTAEQVLQAAGCQVERLSGRTQEETNQMLYDLVAQNQRFRSIGRSSSGSGSASRPA